MEGSRPNGHLHGSLEIHSLLIILSAQQWWLGKEDLYSTLLWNAMQCLVEVCSAGHDRGTHRGSPGHDNPNQAVTNLSAVWLVSLKGNAIFEWKTKSCGLYPEYDGHLGND